jgi:protein ImuB
MSDTELYACVCVKEFPAQALLRMRPDLRNRACVVMEEEPPLERVCSLTRKARSLGLMHGMTKVEVESFSDVVVLHRSEDEEIAAKSALLECAGSFSPRVEDCSQSYMFLCAIDIAGTEKLFGPPQTLGEELCSRVRSLGITACIAISGGFHTAMVSAKALTLRNQVCVIHAGKESEALAPLSLDVLDLTDDRAEVFSLWGIRTLGMLAELPEKELIARLGQEGKRLRQMARGELTHLFRPVEPEFALRERMDLDTPIEVLDALLFVVNLMLDQVIQRASARVLALAEVKIALSLEKGTMHERAVRPALPTNDRQLWLKLLHLDLEAHPPQAAIVAVTLEAEPGRTSKVQLGLFTPQLPEPSRLDVTLARIEAVVGEGNVGSAVLKDKHGSDNFSVEPFRVAPIKGREESSCLARPALRKLRPSEPIFVVLDNCRPQTLFFRDRRYAVERAYGPWLSSGEWWNPLLWGCEQWDVVARAHSGEMLCCCVLRDVVRDRWQMEAFYD